MFACKSATSVAVERRAPVMASVPRRCTRASWFVMPTDPPRLTCPSSWWIGVYHTSAAYVSFGTATARYSLLMNFELMPEDCLASLRYINAHLVALANADLACVAHLSS